MAARARPLEIYGLLPKTNCAKCGETNCMAFAIKLLEKSQELAKCVELEDPKYREQKQKLIALLAPPVSAVTIGTGEKAVTIGGEEVMYRHELAYYHPTAVAITVDDTMRGEELLKRIKAVEEFQIARVGQNLKLNMIAVRCPSNDTNKFSNTVSEVLKHSRLPLIICSYDPRILEAGLSVAKAHRPLIYATTKDNWKQVGELALKYSCPVAISAPNDLTLLRSLANSLTRMGVSDIVLDPGTFPDARTRRNYKQFHYATKSRNRE